MRNVESSVIEYVLLICLSFSCKHMAFKWPALKMVWAKISKDFASFELSNTKRRNRERNQKFWMAEVRGKYNISAISSAVDLSLRADSAWLSWSTWLWRMRAKNAANRSHMRPLTARAGLATPQPLHSSCGVGNDWALDIIDYFELGRWNRG